MKRRTGGMRLIELILVALLVLPLVLRPAAIAWADDGSDPPPENVTERLSTARPQTMGDALKGDPYFGYGVTVQLLGQPVAPLLNGIEGMHFNWVRQHVRWGAIEPAAGSYQWDQLDSVVNDVGARGLHLLLVISGTPDWARPAEVDLSHDGPPAEAASFGAFVSVLAARYHGLVDAYQVWQAPNAVSHWNSPAGPAASEYVNLLKHAYEAVRTNAPGALVVSASLSPNSQSGNIDALVYLSEMIGMGAGSWYDVLGISILGSQSQRPGGEGLLVEYVGMDGVMSRGGAAEKPIWLTDLQWDCSAAGGLSEELQAELIVGLVQEAERTTALQVVVVDDFNTALVDPAAPRGCSLIRSDWSAHPAFLELAEMRQEHRFFGNAGPGRRVQNRAPQLGVKPYLYRPSELD